MSERKPYIQRQPFINETKFEVGQIKIVNSKAFIITAITRVTDRQFKIYGLPTEQTMKLNEYKEFQKRREAGQINVYLPGTHILNVTIK